MSSAARVGDQHTCPLITGNIPHTGGKIIGPGSPNVIICGLPAATVGDRLICMNSMDTIINGSATVLINNKPAARLGDKTTHGGVIIEGCINVLIGG